VVVPEWEATVVAGAPAVVAVEPPAGVPPVGTATGREVLVRSTSRDSTEVTTTPIDRFARNSTSVAPASSCTLTL